MWVAKMMITYEVMCMVLTGKVVCKVMTGKVIDKKMRNVMTMIMGGWGMIGKAQGRSRTAKVQWQST